MYRCRNISLIEIVYLLPIPITEKRFGTQNDKEKSKQDSYRYCIFQFHTRILFNFHFFFLPFNGHILREKLIPILSEICISEYKYYFKISIYFLNEQGNLNPLLPELIFLSNFEI